MEFNKSVKKILFVFFCLFSVIVFNLIKFYYSKGKTLANSSNNLRNIEKQNDTLRGSIYSSDMQLLAYSEKPDIFTQKRYYPFGPLFAHCVGYSSSRFGKSALENDLNTELVTFTDKEDDTLKDKDIDFYVDLFNKRTTKIEKVGNSVVTTLEPNIQKVAWDSLGDYKGAAIVIKPKTGEILAAVSKPSYDPNNLEVVLSTKDSTSPLLNRAFNGVYPPGSTFKIVTTSSTLQNIEGAAYKSYYDSGILELGNGFTLSNANNAAYGSVDLEHAFINSSNVIFGSLALELGETRLKSTAESFGFNQDIPSIGFSCSSGSYPEMKDYEKGMLAQSGIGQGYVTVSPLQVALVGCAIANDGVIMKPKLINKVLNYNKEEIESVNSEVWKRAVPGDVSSMLKKYMTNLVSSHSWPFMEGLSVGGKTGTADFRGSSGNLMTPHSWFVGFMPADNPEYVVVVIAEEGNWGAKTAAPIAANILRFINR